MNNVNIAVEPEHLPQNARIWRVGSLSMGVTLILMGTGLAVSFWQEIEAYEMLMWVAPVVFIMLGVELLLYLKLSSSERAIVRYDWISVFFVGVIGAVSLGLALLMSTGLFDELQRGLQMTQRTAFIETKMEQVPASIERIVVHTYSDIQLTETDSRELQLFGQVRYSSSKPMERQDGHILKTETVGSTLYVMIGSLDNRDGGIVSDHLDMHMTLAVPKGVKVSYAEFSRG
ncbi:hypothetical protein BK133_18270 [Paenibacillus sp. FSL H8-0548]|uniref:hypothetical protein n=1 Tax=Paenibacillus sp. FSL H8-0548 TaxID=1920422 RepID=UPI00096D36EC|nr:hypothetical protein [Paenibacillus sp. FSL H8-0548]OMF29086.1 hypothetical protein BK133_18270 [Paenibacillus sp. FSL H8-0548]